METVMECIMQKNAFWCASAVCNCCQQCFIPQQKEGTVADKVLEKWLILRVA
jgi:hypothetical protein